MIELRNLIEMNVVRVIRIESLNDRIMNFNEFASVDSSSFRDLVIIFVSTIVCSFLFAKFMSAKIRMSFICMFTTSLKQNDDEIDAEIVAESNKEKTFLLEREVF
jgi:uncharacterized membrane protein YciS (DUF1049 family)